MTLTRWHLIHIAGWLIALAALALTFLWARENGWTDPEVLSDALEPYRKSWFGLPLAVGIFVVAELFMFPVLVLIAICGLAFGPWLGGVYALTGAVASGIIPFLVGRRLGQKRLLKWGGAPARKLAKALEKRGVVAVFLVRKIPAPFTAVNLLCGASGLTLVEFMLGTALGMITGIVLIMVVGANVAGVMSDPGPGQIALGIGLLLAAATTVLLLQRLLNRRLERSR